MVEQKCRKWDRLYSINKKDDRSQKKGKTALLNICANGMFEVANLHVIRSDFKFKVP